MGHDDEFGEERRLGLREEADPVEGGIALPDVPARIGAIRTVATLSIWFVLFGATNFVPA